MRKRILVLCAALFCAVGLLTSCGQSMTDEEAKNILSDLVPRSQLLNEVFWGEAMTTDDPYATPMESLTGAQYYPVSEDSPFQSIAEIKAECAQVYTASYAATMYAMAFDGTDEIDSRYSEENGQLLLDITFEPYNIDTVINIDSAKVVDSTDMSVVVEVDCTIHGEAKKRKITLCKENEVWLLDSPTY